MIKYSIPKSNKDLKELAIRKNVKYILCYVLYLAFFTLAMVSFVSNRYDGAAPLKWWVYPVYFTVVAVSGWMICFMNRFVFDHSFSGKIEKMSFSRSFGRGLSRNAKLSIDYHTYIKLVACDERGKKHKVKVQLFDDGYDGYYKEGGEVVKFRGLNYPLCLESEVEGAHMCAVCGVRTCYVEGKTVHGTLKPEFRDGTMICRSCGHTMIYEGLKGGNTK